MIKNIFSLIIFLVIYQLTFSQEIFQAGNSVSEADSLYLITIPQLQLPDNYKGPNANPLPSEINNAELPFFRPVFTQGGWECGQAAAIGYTFTYEMNRVRNANGSLEANQYPTHFSLNYFNLGEYQIGVCYLYSFDMMKYTGSPNVIDYGGLAGSATKWMNNYEKYYNAMHNPVKEIYSIDVSTEAGILTLKNWLNDHLDGSANGGLANFYVDMGEPSETLAPGTPEEGKFIVPYFGLGSGHALTIVGYNDSIRYDYNNDGQYTNHLDINNDGDVNVQDWEIGGILFVNSFGTSWGNDGFCYSMYKTLAEEKENGGIWNKSVHVIDVKEDYTPLLTYKVKLHYSSRNKLKVIAGVALDTSAIFPEYTLEFPVFNYQGGDHYMQGDDSNEDHREIEFGLDVTPLLSYIPQGQTARFFLKLHENDPFNSNTGEIEYFSLLDYTQGGLEIHCQDNHVPINENSFTCLFINHNLSFDKVGIETESLAGLIPGEPYTFQLEASGGTEPYKWAIHSSFHENIFNEPYPDFQGEQLNFNSNLSGYVIRPLEFDFPFYGGLFDTIIICTDGFLTLNDKAYPIPYQVNDQFLFEQEKMLAILFNKNLLIKPELGNGVWFDGDSEEASIRWKVSYSIGSNDLQFDFSCIISDDGQVKYYFNDAESVSNIRRITGISNGDGINFHLSDLSNIYPDKSGTAVRYSPENFSAEMQITNDGMLSVSILDENKIYNITASVTDDLKIFDIKDFQLSDGIIYDLSVNSGDDDQIDYGETASISFGVSNISDQPLNNVAIHIQITDQFINILDNTEIIGALGAGQVINLSDAVSFEVSSDIPDNYSFPLMISFSSNEKNWESISHLTAYAPEFVLGDPIILDDGNGKADPGETFDLVLSLSNHGHSKSTEVIANYFENDPYITINSGLETFFGDIGKHQTTFDTLSMTLNEDTPIGHLCEFAIHINATSGFQKTLYFSFVTGRIPVLIVDMDVAGISGPVLSTLLDEMNYLYSYQNYIPDNIDDYKTAFVLLGRKYIQHMLTQDEGQKLADFLNGGGYIYMEGGETWHYETQTVVHPMFNVTTEGLTWHYNDTILGTENSFTANMKFPYDGPMPYYGYYFVPGDSAYSILKNDSDPHPMCVVFQNSMYRTIASAIDFGGLEDVVSPSTKEELLLLFLDFFGLETNTSIQHHIKPEPNFIFNCFPNPITQNSTFTLKIESTQEVQIGIYDIYGKLIFEILDKSLLNPGEYSFKWNSETSSGKPVKSGMYFCRLKAGSSKKVIKLIVIN